MKTSAIELIKNSLDAFLDAKEREKSGDHTVDLGETLNISFELDVNETTDRVKVTISDNAGGFSPNNLTTMNKHRTIEELAASHGSSKKGLSNRFGGHGLGLRQLQAGLLGMELHPDKVTKRKLDWSKNPVTNSSFSNVATETGAVVGGQVALETPLEKIPLVAQSSGIVHQLKERVKKIFLSPPSEAESVENSLGETDDEGSLGASSSDEGSFEGTSSSEESSGEETPKMTTANLLEALDGLASAATRCRTASEDDCETLCSSTDEDNDDLDRFEDLKAFEFELEPEEEEEEEDIDKTPGSGNGRL